MKLEKSLAAEINHLYTQAMESAGDASFHAGAAAKRVLQCGLKLAEAKAAHPGEFLDWLKAHCPRIGERTAQRFMACARKYPTALSDGSLEHQSVKELYLAVGILPEPPQETPARTMDGPAPAPWLRFTQRFDARISRARPEERPGLKQELEELVNWCRVALQRL